MSRISGSEFRAKVPALLFMTYLAFSIVRTSRRSTNMVLAQIVSDHVSLLGNPLGASSPMPTLKRSQLTGRMKSLFYRLSWMRFARLLMVVAIAYQSGTGQERWLLICYAIWGS